MEMLNRSYIVLVAIALFMFTIPADILAQQPERRFRTVAEMQAHEQKTHEQITRDFRTQMREGLDRTGQNLADLRGTFAGLDDEARAQATERADELQQRWTELDQRIQAIERGDEQPFEAMRAELRRRAAALEADLATERFLAMQQRDQFTETYQTALADFDRDIQQLEGRIQETERRDAYQRTLGDLRDRRQQLDQRFDQFQAAPEAEWGARQRELTQDLTIMSEDLRRAQWQVAHHQETVDFYGTDIYARAERQ